MSLPRFFLDSQVLSAETEPVFPLRLGVDDMRHARVLRLRPGEHIAVIDAAQDYFECEIVSMADGVSVRIAAHEKAPEIGRRVVLLQGLSKGDKMDTVIRHATELGVSAFIPLSCSRSVLKLDPAKSVKRTERWRSIAKSAAMQSGQAAVPEVSEPKTPAEAAEMLGQFTAVLVCWEEERAGSLRRAIDAGLAYWGCLAADAKVAVVVGPEGGLTSEEVRTLLACNPAAASITLGPGILRTETAGVVAPALVLYELGGLQ